MNNSWPGGKRRPLSQSEHGEWNAKNYPGTRQLCVDCEAPTGRCEDHGWFFKDHGPLCNSCWADHFGGTK